MIATKHRHVFFSLQTYQLVGCFPVAAPIEKEFH
jgi:hypothetical protein